MSCDYPQLSCCPGPHTHGRGCLAPSARMAEKRTRWGSGPYRKNDNTLRPDGRPTRRGWVALQQEQERQRKAAKEAA